MPKKSHQADADSDTDCGKQCRQDGRGPDVAPLRGETALGENHDEGGEAERLRQIGIVEWNPDAGLTHHQAQTEKQQQGWKTDPSADPSGDDRGDQDDGTYQEDDVDLNHAHILHQVPVSPQ